MADGDLESVEKNKRIMMSMLKSINPDKFDSSISNITNKITELNESLSKLPEEKQKEINSTIQTEINSYFETDTYTNLEIELQKKLLSFLGEKFSFLSKEIEDEQAEIKKEESVEGRFKAVRDEINSACLDQGDSLHNKITNFTESINNLPKITGKNADEKLKNFVSLIQPILESAKSIEGKNEESPNSFMRLAKLESQLPLLAAELTDPNDKEAMKLKAKIEKKINEKSVALEDFALATYIKNAKLKLMQDTYKDEIRLVSYLFDKIEDVLKTPKETKSILLRSENELKSLTADILRKEADEKNKEIKEFVGGFDNIIRYFQQNSKELKSRDMNETMIRQYLNDAFDKLPYADPTLQSIFEKNIKDFDNACQDIYKKLLVSKDLEDAPIYGKALQFIRNVVKVYIIIAKEFQEEKREEEVIAGMIVAQNLDIVKIIGNPEADEEGGLSGEWIKRMDDCLKLFPSDISELLKTSKNEINFFSTQIGDLKNIIKNFSDLSVSLIENNGLRELIEKIIKSENTPQDKANAGDKLKTTSNSIKITQNNIQNKDHNPKQIIPDVGVKDNEIKKVNNEIFEKEEERIEELQEFKSKVKNFNSLMNELVLIVEELQKMVMSPDEEGSKEKILHLYSNMILSYKKVYNFLEELNKSTVPMVNFIITNYNTLMLYYGNPKEKIDNIEKIRKDMNDIRELLLVSGQNKERLGLTSGFKEIQEGFDRKTIEKECKNEDITPEEINDFMKEMNKEGMD